MGVEIMRSRVLFKPQAEKKPNPFLFNDFKNLPRFNFSWQMLHNKTLRTSGRGGKWHLIGGAPAGWNRKGRWTDKAKTVEK
jgi:hypothetical protein